MLIGLLERVIMNELKFSTVLKEVPVKITGPDGKEKDYTLRELTGKLRDLFLNDMGARVKLTAGVVESISNFVGLQSGLLALCLFNENDKPVPADEIESYPATVVAKLFEVAQELSGLDEGAPKSAKNE